MSDRNDVDDGRAGRSLTELLDEWHAVHRSYQTDIGTMSPNPATDDQIRAAEAAVGFAFPPEVWEWYRWSNGFTADEGYSFKRFLPTGWAAASLEFPIEMALENEPEVVAVSYYSTLGLRQDDGERLDPPAPLAVAVVWVMDDDMLLGVECSGPRTGAVYWAGEGPGGWTARSLSDLLRRALRFHDLGLLRFDAESEQIETDADAVRARWPETNGIIRQWFNDPDEGIPAWPDSLLWRWPT